MYVEEFYQSSIVILLIIIIIGKRDLFNIFFFVFSCLIIHSVELLFIQHKNKGIKLSVVRSGLLYIYSWEVLQLRRAIVSVRIMQWIKLGDIIIMPGKNGSLLELVLNFIQHLQRVRRWLH